MKNHMKKLTRRRFIKAGILSLIGFTFLDFLWFEKYIIDWNSYDISENQINKLKIIQISDLHLDRIESFHKRIAKN